MGNELSEDMGDGCVQNGTLSKDTGDTFRGFSAALVVGCVTSTLSTGEKRS